MAENSGFFEAQWDSSLVNPETGQQTGYWDRTYLAADFADYFKNFVGNGVFASPTNQLKVVASSGMVVKVKTGFGFINGFWYENNTEKSFTVPSNSGATSRIDSIILRFDLSLRKISLIYQNDSTSITRTGAYYDLKLCEITVASNAQSITDAVITDTRSNESVCGFVKGLIDVVGTDDLFAQFTSIFNAWFETVQDQVTGDLAVQLQSRMSAAESDIDKIENGTTTVGKATEATRATNIGTATLGSSSEPIYINNGVPTKCTDVPKVIYQNTEPTTVQAGTIVFVYD